MTRRWLMALAIGMALALPARAQDVPAVDSDGFIRDWLVLAPIPLETQSGADEIHRPFLPGEATLTPKAGERVSVGARVLTWTAHQSTEYILDLRQSFDPANGEYVAGYAVAYVIADEAMDVTLALSTNDQGQGWFNGRPVFLHEETRTLGLDDNRIPVSLVKGRNVLVLKVVNEVNSWQACVRFLRGDTPIRGLRLSLSPES